MARQLKEATRVTTNVISEDYLISRTDEKTPPRGPHNSSDPQTQGGPLGPKLPRPGTTFMTVILT